MPPIRLYIVCNVLPNPCVCSFTRVCTCLENRQESAVMCQSESRVSVLYLVDDNHVDRGELGGGESAHFLDDRLLDSRHLDDSNVGSGSPLAIQVVFLAPDRILFNR